MFEADFSRRGIDAPHLGLCPWQGHTHRTGAELRFHETFAWRLGDVLEIALVAAAAAVFLDQEHVVGVASVAVLRPVHAGAAHGHAGHRQAQGLGPLAQQALDLAHVHMAFDHVAVDQRGVAGRKFRGQSQALAHGGVAGVEGLNLKTGFAQDLDPVLAAAAVGVFPDLHDGQLFGAVGQRGPRCAGQGRGSGDQGGAAGEGVFHGFLLVALGANTDGATHARFKMAGQQTREFEVAFAVEGPYDVAGFAR